LSFSKKIFQTSFKKRKLKLALPTNIAFSNYFIEHTNHKFLDLFKTTINLSPTNKSNKIKLNAQQIEFNNQFIKINNPKQSKKRK